MTVIDQLWDEDESFFSNRKKSRDGELAKMMRKVAAEVVDELVEPAEEPTKSSKPPMKADDKKADDKKADDKKADDKKADA